MDIACTVYNLSDILINMVSSEQKYLLGFFHHPLESPYTNVLKSSLMFN